MHEFKISKTLFGHLIIAVILIVVSASLLETRLSTEYNVWIGRLGLLVIIWCGSSLHKSTGKWFTLTYMFEISFAVFTFGQSIICGLGMENGTFDQYNREPVVDVNVAYIFTIICLICLHIGVLCYSESNHRKKKRLFSLPEDHCDGDYSAIMKPLGIIIFVLSVIPFLYESIRLVSVYRVAGYAEAYSSISGATSWSKIFSLVADYFPFSLFLLYIGYRNDRVIRKISAFTIIGISLLNFAIGNRSEPICYLVALVWLNNRIAASGAQKRKTAIIAVITVLILLMIIPVIGETRNTGELSIDTILNSFTGESSVLDTVAETVSNLGYSVFPLIKTMQLIPERFGFHYGESYFYALLSIFPNIFGGTHVSVSHAALAQWLMRTLGMTYGPGYSIPAEAYYNFGWAGVLVMVVLGWIIARLLYENEEASNLKLFTAVACFIVLFSVPRRDTLTAIRNIVYYVGLIYLIIRLFAIRSYRGMMDEKKD